MGRAAGFDDSLGTACAMALELDGSKHARRAVPIKRGGQSAAVSAALAALARDGIGQPSLMDFLFIYFGWAHGSAQRQMCYICGGEW